VNLLGSYIIDAAVGGWIQDWQKDLLRFAKMASGPEFWKNSPRNLLVFIGYGPCLFSSVGGFYSASARRRAYGELTSIRAQTFSSPATHPKGCQKNLSLGGVGV